MAFHRRGGAPRIGSAAACLLCYLTSWTFLVTVCFAKDSFT